MNMRLSHRGDEFLVPPPKPPRMAGLWLRWFVPAGVLSGVATASLSHLPVPTWLYFTDAIVIGGVAGRQAWAAVEVRMRRRTAEYDRQMGHWIIAELQAAHERKLTRHGRGEGMKR